MTEPREEPPQAPEVQPRLRFRKLEIVGVGIMALLPLAALAGAFGPAMERQEARAGSLTIEAEYPSRIRNAMTERITVDLSNEAAAPVSDIEVAFEPAFVEAFENLMFTPEPEHPYVFTIDTLEPGETRRIAIEVLAREYGRHEGTIGVDHAGGTAELPVRTTIFP